MRTNDSFLAVEAPGFLIVIKYTRESIADLSAQSSSLIFFYLTKRVVNMYYLEFRKINRVIEEKEREFFNKMNNSICWTTMQVSRNTSY